MGASAIMPVLGSCAKSACQLARAHPLSNSLILALMACVLCCAWMIAEIPSCIGPISDQTTAHAKQNSHYLTLQSIWL